MEPEPRGALGGFDCVPTPSESPLTSARSLRVYIGLARAVRGAPFPWRLWKVADGDSWCRCPSGPCQPAPPAVEAIVQGHQGRRVDARIGLVQVRQAAHPAALCRAVVNCTAAVCAVVCTRISHLIGVYCRRCVECGFIDASRVEVERHLVHTHILPFARDAPPSVRHACPVYAPQR